MSKQQGVRIAVAVFGLVLVLGLFLFEPVTRQYVANDDVCSYCHVDREYRSEARLSFSKPHPLPVADDVKTDKVPEQATCVQCHLPTGFVNTFFAYTHFASLSDLFGHFRDRMGERAGAWIPPRQVAAFRVRDRLFEYDSETCRVCHIEREIEPKRERGRNAHKKALDEKMTCIECHYNEKHQRVDLRKNAFVRADSR